jgi:hypothetical protein
MMRPMAGACRFVLLAGIRATWSVLPVAALALLIPLASRADQPAAASASPIVCQKPDDALIKSKAGNAGRMEVPDSEKINLYNAQARAFNDCMKKLIESSSAEMDRSRNDGNAAIRDIAQTANRQIRDISEKIEAANAGGSAAETEPDPAGWQFPDADCVAPDKALLARTSGRKGASVSATRTGQYDRQAQAYQACVKTYVDQARAEARLISVTSDARVKLVMDKTNAEITRVQNLVNSAIRAANNTAADEVRAVRDTPLELNPKNSLLEGVEHVTVEGHPPEQVSDTPKGDGDPHAIVCRKPQQLANSRLPGPEICKRNRVWAALYKAGKDISADGQNIVPSEKLRSANPAAMACSTTTTGSQYQGYITNTYCN